MCYVMKVHVWKSKGSLECQPQEAIRLLTWSLLLAQSSPFVRGQATETSSDPPAFLPLPSTGIIGMGHHAIFFI